MGAGSALIHRIGARFKVEAARSNPVLTASIGAQPKAEAVRNSRRSMVFIGAARRRSPHNRHRVTVTMAAPGATLLPRTLFESALPS
jgi:hypothetical protein